MTQFRRFIVVVCTTLTYTACTDGDDGHQEDQGSPDQAGSVCEVPEDCYPEVEDHGDIQGEVLCLERVRAGYCTHECTEDADCCAAEGECTTDLPQVCAPFESTGMNMCFLSCEPEEVESAGATDDQAFCQEHVSPDFICRSTGGGASNRQVCVPGDCGVGAGCGSDADCDPDLTCLDEFDGGYCGVRGCESNADCPMNSLCVSEGDATYCARSCAAESDCSFCRVSEVASACTAEVDFVESGTTGSVCIPPA